MGFVNIVGALRNEVDMMELNSASQHKNAKHSDRTCMNRRYRTCMNQLCSVGLWKQR